MSAVYTYAYCWVVSLFLFLLIVHRPARSTLCPYTTLFRSGVYVEIIENKCEGMVRLQDIPGDFYVFNKDDYAVQGRRTKYTYQLGDEVIVRVKQADLVRKHLDFILLGHK